MGRKHLEVAVCTKCGRGFTPVRRPLVLRMITLFGEENMICLPCARKAEKASDERIREILGAQHA